MKFRPSTIPWVPAFAVGCRTLAFGNWKQSDDRIPLLTSRLLQIWQRSIRVPSLLLLIVGLVSGYASYGSDSVTLSWSPSPSRGVIGYRVYYGQTSGSYTDSIDIGNETTGTICCLSAGVTYFFAVKAYLTSGEESVFSEETSYLVKGAPDLPPEFDPLYDTSITTDGTERELAITSIPGWQGRSQPLVISTSSSRPDLVPAPTVNYVSPATTGTIRIAPVPNALGLATITVTIDNGQAVNNLFSRSFDLTLRALNTPPTFSPLADTSITSDGTALDIPLTEILAGAAGEDQPLTISATSSRPDLVLSPTVSYVSPESTATLRIAPMLNNSGIATITVTIDDGQPANNRFSRTFIVTVKAPNSPPRLDAIAGVTIAEDTKPKTILLTGIEAGRADAQPLTVTAVSSLPALLPHPVVSYVSPSSTATLTFAPSPNLSGLVDVTVTVRQGQLANTEVARTFRVTIYPLNDPPSLRSEERRVGKEC